jgi:hypothetical protein
METTREHTEWREELGNGTKLVNLRFRVVVHRMSTKGFVLLEKKKKEIIDKSCERIIS